MHAGIARAFLGKQAAQLEDQMGEKQRKIKEKWEKLRKCFFILLTMEPEAGYGLNIPDQLSEDNLSLSWSLLQVMRKIMSFIFIWNFKENKKKDPNYVVFKYRI